MNIMNQTPLEGVKLFQSNTYPSESIDLYWRGSQPIIFELSDTPDRGDAYPHFLAMIQDKLDILDAKTLTSNDQFLLTAEVQLDGCRPFYVTQEDDVVVLSIAPAKLTGEFKEGMMSMYQVSVFLLAIYEAVLATTFSPVDLCWLLGPDGRSVGLYDSKIWKEAERRLPGSYFLDLLGTTEGTLLDPK